MIIYFSWHQTGRVMGRLIYLLNILARLQNRDNDTYFSNNKT